MKALMMVITNSQEIEEAKQLAQLQAQGDPKEDTVSLVIPEPKHDHTDFLFDPNNVSLSYIGSDGSIRILYDGQDLSLKYDEKVFKELENNFKNRQLN